MLITSDFCVRDHTYFNRLSVIYSELPSQFFSFFSLAPSADSFIKCEVKKCKAKKKIGCCCCLLGGVVVVAANVKIKVYSHAYCEAARERNRHGTLCLNLNRDAPKKKSAQVN